ncbi:tetratricopeptide repeat protein [Sinomicrobium sp. M5D2P9]
MSEPCLNHIENYWKTKTNTSNKLFRKGQFEEALVGYKDALYRAEVLNHNLSACIRHHVPFIQVYIISCNNIAYTHVELKQEEQAEIMFRRVIYYLLHLLHKQHPDIKTEEIQNELKRAAITYTDFVTENKGDKNLLSVLTALKKQLQKSPG